MTSQWPEEWSQADDRASTGCSPCPSRPSSRTSLRFSSTLPDNSNSGKGASSIGSSSLRSGRKLLWPPSGRPLDPTMPSYRDQRLVGSIAGKKRPGLPVRNSSLAPYPSEETVPPIGTKSEISPSPDELMIYRRTYSFGIFYIYISCYNQLRRIGQDYARPVAMERSCHVFWGDTGTGKSRRAWEEAGIQAYCKDPRTKW